MVEGKLLQRQSKTATTPNLLLLRIHNLDKHQILDKIDAILCNNNINYKYSHKSGYLPNSDFLSVLQQFYKMDGYAGLSLIDYLHGIYDDKTN